MYKLEKAEHETVIRTDALMDCWIVCTRQRRYCTKLHNLPGVEIISEITTPKGNAIEGVYKIPLNQISFRKRRKLGKL